MIDYHVFKSLVNGFFYRHSGGDHRPVFYEVEACNPALQLLPRNYPAIRAEVDRYLGTGPNLPLYHEVNPPAEQISAATPGRWDVFLLELLGRKMDANLEKLPITASVLDRIPHKIQAFLSVLEPGKSVPLHRGPYLGYLRYHLALRVPDESPPYIVVNGQPYRWKEGEGVLFDDSWPHEVINHSSGPRVVLIVDVLRPLPRLADLANRLLLKTVVGATYGRKVEKLVKEYHRC